MAGAAGEIERTTIRDHGATTECQQRTTAHYAIRGSERMAVFADGRNEIQETVDAGQRVLTSGNGSGQ
jgi:hypothetical protein